ncbi:N2227-like protein-domain-containing protein [Tirmania nivea]|nr:N2227-like protein-domain-containing protein [Tirmania nivea]
MCGVAREVVVEGGDENDDDGNDDEEEESGEIEAGVKDDGEHSISDPLSDPAELKALTSTLSSYYLYRRTAHLNLTHQRRKEYWALSRKHREVLERAMNGAGESAYLGMLSSLDAAIAENAEVAEGIFASGVGAFGTQKGKKVKKPWWETHATTEDMDKVKSTLKQFYRDWALEGHAERERCYKPVLDELCSRFPLNEDIDPNEIKVLVPGAGLGRLAFDIVCAGFESQGNEFSYHQLVASNFVLNCTSKVNEFTIHPFIHSFSHHITRQNHLRSVQIPDVHPGHLLINHTTTLPQNPYSPSSASSSSTSTPSSSPPYSLPATRFSMIAGDFLQCYGSEGSTNAWDAVCTVFFIDTAPNVIAYVETIYRVLRKGGVWVNLGPLLWHWEGREVPKRSGAASNQAKDEPSGSGRCGIEVGGSVELTLEEVLGVVEACGFKIERRNLAGEGGGGDVRDAAKGELGEVRTGYIQDERSMLNYEYRAQYWVAVKV